MLRYQLAGKRRDPALRPQLRGHWPGRQDGHPVEFELPTIGMAADAATAVKAIVAAVAQKDVTPSEAGEVAKVVATSRRGWWRSNNGLDHEGQEIRRPLRARTETPSSAS